MYVAMVVVVCAVRGSQLTSCDGRATVVQSGLTRAGQAGQQPPLPTWWRGGCGCWRCVAIAQGSEAYYGHVCGLPDMWAAGTPDSACEEHMLEVRAPGTMVRTAPCKVLQQRTSARVCKSDQLRATPSASWPLLRLLQLQLQALRPQPT